MLIYQGAESKIILKQGIIEKIRVKKSYRVKQLDELLRKHRTRIEAKMLRKAREAGVLTPKIIEVDEKNSTIKMEFLKGISVRDYLHHSYDAKICKQIGIYVARLHQASIAHGDLTTSNMIISKGKLYFIDFGLAQHTNRIEDFAQDLLVLKECLISTHTSIANKCWRQIINSYRKNFIKAEQVLKKIEEIERRGRYTKKQS